ncbi:TOBE domain-containing protein [Ramlibacter sp. WS9]|uniref:TOBE domain-containing protein n=1 Tax=Ramlibacter sp. WS9 TaxID=1882741 RepID=UPI0011444B79|nr:TOBE domain-containing protein [Ramlibacter sp. WS9]ROZ76577.1 LysR family transcriptional regulator [Ramlibacter sp. WS9]
MATKLKLEGALGHAAADKRLEILRQVGQGGSISQAARVAGVSYKAAWQALDTLSNLAGAALVERAVGGAGGGGARLTPAGEQLLSAARELEQTRAQVLTRIAGRGGALVPAPGLAALGLRTSMRNQLPCVVKSLRAQAGAMRVELSLADGTSLFSRITRESAQLLGLVPRQDVLALCKATAVGVALTAPAVPGRNLLPGIVSRASRAASGGEVALALAGGLQLIGFAGPASGLKVRASAVAWIEESAVAIALPG